jgi:hypothetical protein
MASAKQAQRAARQLKPRLKKHRAFAVDVRKVKGGSGYAVFAFFEKKPRPTLPRSTTITDGAKRVRVPVRVVITELFRPD